MTTRSLDPVAPNELLDLLEQQPALLQLREDIEGVNSVLVLHQPRLLPPRLQPRRVPPLPVLPNSPPSSSSSSKESIELAIGRDSDDNRKMSGSGVKKVVETAAKAAKTKIDWDGMSKLLVSEEARKEFASLRRAFDEVNHELETKFSQEPEPIDWEYYRKGIGSPLVDMYKEAHESIQIPKFVDTVTPEYKPKFDALLVELKEAEQESLKESERLEKEIAQVHEMKKKISTMTAEDYFKEHPEIKKQFDDEIRNDYWGY